MKNPDEDPKLVLYVPYRSEAQLKSDYNEMLSHEESSYKADVAEEKRWQRLSRASSVIWALGIVGAAAKVVTEVTTDLNPHDSILVGALGIMTLGFLSKEKADNKMASAVGSQINTVDRVTIVMGPKLEVDASVERPTWLVEALERPGFTYMKARVSHGPEQNGE